MDCKQQVKLYNSFKKHGIDKHKFELICQCDESELNNLEVYYIDHFKCFNTSHGLNLRSGGDVSKVSDETRKRMSISKTGRKFPYKPRPKAKGRKVWNKGVVGSMRGVGKGRKVSEETREKLRKSHTGQVAWNKGLHTGNQYTKT